MVLTLAGPGEAVVSGRSAAALHRLDGFGPGPLEVSIRRGTTLRAPATVHRVSCLAEADHCHVDGIRCTGVARTLADLAESCSPRDLQRALDDARRRRVSTLWLRQTAERLHRPGRRGPGLLLDLLDEAERERRVPDSWFERLLEAALACPELADMVRQHEVVAVDGRVLARLDLAVPDVLLGIEAHSRRYHFADERQRLDEHRDLLLAAEGWEVLYLGWQATMQPTQALRRILAVVNVRRRQLLAGFGHHR